MRKLSLAALTVLELSPEQVIDSAETAGFDYVGLRLIPATPTEKNYHMMEDRQLQQACIDRLKNSKVQVEDIEILRVLPTTRIADFEAVLELGKRLGARSALVAADDPDENRLLDNLEALAALSAQYDILPHIEFMPWLATSDLGKCVELVNKVKNPNISVLIDSIHFDRSRSNIADWPKYHGTKPRYLQLCDTPTETVANMDEILAQARANRWIPGEGHIRNLPDIIRLTGDEVSLSLEIPGANLPGLPTQERVNTIYQRTRAWLATENI